VGVDINKGAQDGFLNPGSHNRDLGHPIILMWSDLDHPPFNITHGISELVDPSPA